MEFKESLDALLQSFNELALQRKCNESASFDVSKLTLEQAYNAGLIDGQIIDARVAYKILRQILEDYKIENQGLSFEKDIS